MQYIPFRDYHLLAILRLHQEGALPLDLLTGDYFRSHPAIGSKDRAYISDTLYGIIRWNALLESHCVSSPTWEEKLTLYQTHPIAHLQSKEGLPPCIRVSCPEELFDLLKAAYGEDRALKLCADSNTQAPITIRVNPLKITRERLLAKWKELYSVSPTLVSPDGMRFDQKIHFFSLPEFREGLFEVQDEGSQLLAGLVQVKPGELVLDYCAGSGGKTLAFAPRMEHKGQIFLHDVRPRALQEAKKRLRRAGIQNCQLLLPDSRQIEKLKKKMDWVLVDAPCSGTGTLRRNPDMKWRFSKERLARLMGQQRMIFEKALSFLQPNGRIVYGTCSLLAEENEQQVDHFIRTYSLEIEGSPLTTELVEGGMDGFFGVILKKK